MYSPKESIATGQKRPTSINQQFRAPLMSAAVTRDDFFKKNRQDVGRTMSYAYNKHEANSHLQNAILKKILKRENTHLNCSRLLIIYFCIGMLIAVSVVRGSPKS